MQRSDVRMVFVGGPLSLESSYREYARTLGVSMENLRFVEWQAPHMVPVWLSSADVVVFSKSA